MEKHGDHTCEIHSSDADNGFIGQLRYRSFELGSLTASSADAVRAQFRALAKLLDAGAMVRRGTVMIGYHSADTEGEVLLLDGEVIGNWVCDEFEWCHFTASGSAEITCSAPSPWMLQDLIGDWIGHSD